MKHYYQIARDHGTILGDLKSQLQIDRAIQIPQFAGIQIPVSWGSFSRRFGVYDFSVLLAIMKQCHEAGKTVALSITYKNFQKNPSFIGPDDVTTIAQKENANMVEVYKEPIGEQWITFLEVLSVVLGDNPALGPVDTSETALGKDFPLAMIEGMDNVLQKTYKALAGFPEGFSAINYFSGQRTSRLVKIADSYFLGFSSPDATDTEANKLRGALTNHMACASWAVLDPKDKIYGGGVGKTLSWAKLHGVEHMIWSTVAAPPNDLKAIVHLIS